MKTFFVVLLLGLLADLAGARDFRAELEVSRCKLEATQRGLDCMETVTAVTQDINRSGGVGGGYYGLYLGNKSLEAFLSCTRQQREEERACEGKPVSYKFDAGSGAYVREGR